MHDKVKRIKYIRVLEKFFRQNISLLKLENFDYDLYKKRIAKNYEEFCKTQSVELNSNYLIQLKNHINNILYFAQNPKDIDEQRQVLLKEANTILKNKNQSVYKKEKHKAKKFEDGN